MIADLIRLSALYVLVRVFVEITMPASKHVVKYLFWAGIALTIITSVAPVVTRVADDIHELSVTYTQGREMANNILGKPNSVTPKIDVGYQDIWERVSGNASFSYPIKGKVTQEFKESTHHGIDVSGKVGDSIRASRPGKVSKILIDDIYGLTVIINHNNAWETLYAHCSKVIVTEGRIILIDEKIGEVGGAIGDPNAGRSTGPHLHFELRKNGKSLNPADYLK